MPLKAHKSKISLDVDEIVRSDAEGGSYKLLEALPSGGRGQTSIARMLQRPKTDWPLPKTFIKGAKVVIKTANIDKERSLEEILYFVDRVNTTLQREISLLHLLHGLHNVARTLDIAQKRHAVRVDDLLSRLHRGELERLIRLCPFSFSVPKVFVDFEHIGEGVRRSSSLLASLWSPGVQVFYARLETAQPSSTPSKQNTVMRPGVTISTTALMGVSSKTPAKT